MARREHEPKTPVAARLREIRRALGDLDRADVAEALGVSKSTLAYYERGESEPTVSVLIAYRRHYGVNVDWVLTGQGAVFLGENVSVGDLNYHELRRLVWNIAATFWAELPRKTKPDEFADQYLEMLDYLVNRSGGSAESAVEVINFGAEVLKRTSGEGAP
jgi:transcriptional regulator with XRE-family HTH domain